MDRVFCLYKKVGKTPLETILEYKKEHVEFQNVKIAYAGRLDPMAEGLLLCLSGEKCKERDFFQNLDKVYRYKFVTGFSTDSMDMLGIINKQTDSIPDLFTLKQNILEYIQSSLNNSILNLPYPHFSAFSVDGHPLWWWKKQGLIDTITIPKKEMKVAQTKFLGDAKIDFKTFIDSKINIINKISTGDFRQKEIINQWKNYTYPSACIFEFELESNVSSGTYIRSLVESIGTFLNIPTTTTSIVRTRVGEFDLSFCE